MCYKSNPNYNKLKDYWKLIVKNENDLSEEKKYSNHFHKEVSQRDIVTYLINTDKTLKATYECYQGIIEGTNNLVKSIKRIAFDYRKYNHFIARIFLIKGIIKG